MAGAEYFFKEDGGNGHVGLSDTHLNLQLVYDVVGNVDYFLEHSNLLLVADNTYLSAFEEKVSWVSWVNVEVYLGADLFEQDKVALEDKLHLNLVQQNCLLLILRCLVLPLWTEVIY